MHRARAALLALALAGLALPVGAQPRASVTRVEVDSQRAGRVAYCLRGRDWALCDDEEQPDPELFEVPIEYALGLRFGGERTPPVRSAAVPAWLRARFGVTRSQWGRARRTAHGGHDRIDVTRGGRHVHVTRHRCGSAGCDCPFALDVDIVYDASGRLERLRRMSTTCECVDSMLLEDTLSYDASGALATIRRTHYQHPLCHMDDETAAERFSAADLAFPDGTMPPPHDRTECSMDHAASRLTCAPVDGAGQTYTATYSP